MRINQAESWNCATLKLFVLGVAFWSTATFAVDGVLEINASCVEIGCFAGDTPGFPVQLTSPASYRLTSSLTLPDADTVGIRVLADDVSIDLNGFAITGPTHCTGDPSEGGRTCTNEPSDPLSPGMGILGLDLTDPLGFQSRTRIHNGTITGTGGLGIAVDAQAHISDLRVAHVTISGIRTGDASVIRNSTVTQAGQGFTLGDGAIVDGCTATLNENTGIKTGDSGTVRGSSAINNGVYGILAGDGTTVTQSAANGNGEHGINGFAVNPIINNSASYNKGAGIVCSNSCVVVGNTARSNTSFGFSGTTDSALAGNAFRFNNSEGIQISGGTETGENVCGEDLICP